MVEIVGRKKVEGVVTQTLLASGRDFVSQPVDQLEMTYDGIAGDHHNGRSRKAGAREPWYKRGLEMRNERQVSVLAKDELAQIEQEMAIERIEPGWIGANMVLDGIANLSLLPPRTVLIFEGGVSLRVDGYNAPCRLAGGSIATHLGNCESVNDPMASDVALAFKDAGHMKRGLVVWVEREGIIKTGEKVVGHIWPQWIY